MAVNFQRPSAGALNPVSALNYAALGDFAHSGNIAIQACYSREFCNEPIAMTFTHPQRRVKVWAGFAGNLNSEQQLTVLLRAFAAK